MSRLHHWLRRAFSADYRSLSRPRCCRPGLELLETRQLLSASISLEGNGVSLSSYAGVGFQLNAVATMAGYVNNVLDPNLGDFSAQIEWGDGQSSQASLARNTGGSGYEFVVKGSHVYQQAGTYHIQVDASGPQGSSASGETCQAIVAFMPSGLPGTVPATKNGSLPPSNVEVLEEGPGVTLTSYVGVGFQENMVGTLGGFLNGQLDNHIGDFQAWINWGDSSQWAQADLAPNTGGSGYEFQVKGNHVYTQAGPYHIVVYATGPDGTSVSAQLAGASVSNMPSGISGKVPPTATGAMSPSNVGVLTEGPGVTITSYAGVGFQENMVATLGGFLNGQVDTHITDFKAWINWGDSDQWLPADLAPNIGGSGYEFQVKGTHVYAQAGSYHIVVYGVGPDNTSVSGEMTSAQIANMPSGIAGTTPASNAGTMPPSNVEVLTEGPGVTITAKAGVAVQNAVVASEGGFLNGQADPHINDFHAWINWGDDGQWTQATLVPNSGSGYDFLVQGSHVYTQAGTYPIVVYATGPDNTSTSGETTRAEVAANLNPGQVTIQAPADVPEDSPVPVEVTAVGPTGSTDTSVNGQGTLRLNGQVVANVNLHNGTGHVTIEAPSQPGQYVLQGYVSQLVSAPADVEVESQALLVKKFFQGAAQNAQAVAEALKELLDGSYKNAGELEEAAKEEFEGLAKRLGGVAKGLSFVPLALDVVSLWNDLNQHNQEQFGKDFSDAIKNTLLLSISWGVGIITETNPVGAVGGLLLNKAIEQGAETVYKNYLEKGFETQGQELFKALTQGSHSTLLNGGTGYSPGAGDPPPSVLFANPTSGTAGAANLSAAGQDVYAPVGGVYNGVVATFLDATGNTSPASYSALIGWGDGTSSPGTITALPGGGFSVSGSDTYTATGIYTVTVVLLSNDGSTAASYSSATVYPAGPTGATPTANLLAPDVNFQNADFLAPYTFAVTYQDSGLVSASSLAGAVVQLHPPSGAALTAGVVGMQALGTTDAQGNASTIVVTYQVVPPGDNWYAAPPGTYTVSLAGTPVKDVAGHAVAQGTIGTFQADVPPTLSLANSLGIQPGTGAELSDTSGLNLSGHAEAGSTVRIYNGSTFVGSTTAGAAGSWAYPYSASGDGSYDFTVTATDGPGHVSGPSADVRVVVDVLAPTSSVAALPATSPASFTVSWSGQDDAGGSGVASYDIYVSDNGRPFTAWQTTTLLTSATYQGAGGHTYSFYSVATDEVSNRQPTPTGAQATTQTGQNSSATPTQLYVNAVYQDVLGRAVDAPSLAYWSGQLDHGVPRSTMVQQLTHSAEYYATIIQPAYQKYLGRSADAGGLASWIAMMQNGLTDEQLEAGFIGSPEYYQHAGGTDKLWVDAMYVNLLGRGPDAGGEAYWVQQLAHGASRAGVAYGFAASPEREGQHVQQHYQQYLGRLANPSEVAFWVNSFTQGVTNEDIVTGFASSAEYYQKHSG